MHQSAELLLEMARTEKDPKRRLALRQGARHIDLAFSPEPEKPSRAPDYYHLSPGWELRPGEPGYGGIASAALMRCVVTGKTLSGMGGPGFAIHPDVLLMGKSK
jgi:hypothetical protein